MSKKEKIYRRTCCRCKLTYESDSEKSYVCPECKKKNKHKLNTFQNQAYKRPKKVIPSSPDDLFARAREVECYNKKHGTDYSYGKYELAKFFKKI